jgi:hypothetical protein
MTESQKELIAVEVIRTLYSQFDKFPGEEINNRNAPFHEAFLNAFTGELEGKVASIPIFISLASWMHGLNTSLGQSFLEKTSHILSHGQKKEFTNAKRNLLKISSNQRLIINNVITELSNGDRIPDRQLENDIFVSENNLDIDATEFTVDIFIEDSQQITCIELKTVKPNKGIFKVEKQKILEAIIALKNKYPDKSINYFLGFPFDPLSDAPTGYDKSRYMDYSVGFRKYFAENEFLLSAELWNYLSGENGTMEYILEIINIIATPDFLEIFDFINDFSNIKKDKEKYIRSLKYWSLYSNVEIAENIDVIEQKLSSDRKLQRYLNQNLFDNNISFRTDRAIYLKTFL